MPLADAKYRPVPADQPREDVAATVAEAYVQMTRRHRDYTAPACASGPSGVLERIEGPVAFQPGQDRVIHGIVEFGSVGTHSRADGRPPPARAALGRIDVDAADDTGACLEHGIGETAALGEVLRVPFQVAQILLQGHLLRPALVGKSGRRPDVVDAGHPGGIIRLVVLWPERLQPESVSAQPLRHREIVRHE
jgi:hypothetical protein